MGLGSQRGDTRKVNLVLTPTRPPSPLGGQEGVNLCHSLASMKTNSLAMANKEPSLPEQQNLRRDGGTGSPVPSRLCLSQEQDRAWGAHTGDAPQEPSQPMCCVRGRISAGSL